MESAYDTFAPRHVPVVPLRQAQIEKQVNEAREAKQFYDELRQRLFAQGAQEYKGAKHLVNRFDYEELIVRREDPLRIEGLLDEGELIISTEGKGYVNATRWDQHTTHQCLATAFLEGRMDHHGVVTVAGYAKNGLREQRIRPGMDANPLHEERVVCSVEGVVRKEDLRFLIVRIPIQRFSDTEMTEEELEAFEAWSEGVGRRKPLYIFRVFTFETAH